MGTLSVLVLIVAIGLIIYFGSIVAYRLSVFSLKKSHRKAQARQLKFLQVKIPLKSVSKSSDIDARDHIQDMKQNIEIMNQVYKNVYALYDDGKKHKRLGYDYVSMEMFIERESIKYVISVPREHVGNFEKLITSFYVGATVDRIEQPQIMEAGKYMYGGDMVLKKDSIYPIKNYESFEADPMDSLLGAYSRVSLDEKICLQILLEPIDEDAVEELRKKVEEEKEGSTSFLAKIGKAYGKISGKEEKKDDNNDKNKHKFSQQQIGDFDKKLEDELFNVKIRAIATSPEKQRPKKIIEDLVSSFAQYNYIGLNGFKFEKAKNIQSFAREFIWRNFYSHKNARKRVREFNKKQLLNIKELSSMLHFPHSRFNLNPRLSRQKYRVVAAPDNLPTEGMLIGYNEYGGIKKEVRLQAIDRFRHVYVIGQTGTGKTTLMLLQAINDMREGNGFCYIDPHGDACEDLLSRFPKDRIDDLIYFDLSNTEYPIGFNVLQAENEDERDIITNDLVEMFVSLYGPEIFGPRIQDYFRNACFLLMEQPEGGTLVDIMRLFTDEAFAESKIRNVKNPVIAAWWNKTYKKMGAREKGEIIPFIQAKFGPFTTGVYVRNVIGQPKPEFNIFDAMQEKKIILCNLSKGLSGEVNSQLIGRMLTMQIKIAALKRAAIPQEDRVPYFLYIDEFQNYVSKSIESVLSEARKYRLGLTVAHQYIEQLKQSGLSGNLDLSTAIFGNIGTIFSLKVGAPDAEFLEKEFSPEFGQSDLINMDKFKGVMKMSVDSQQSRPFSFAPIYREGLDIEKNSPEKIEIIKQISALKRGTKRELVDKEIYFRVGV